MDQEPPAAAASAAAAAAAGPARVGAKRPWEAVDPSNPPTINKGKKVPSNCQSVTRDQLDENSGEFKCHVGDESFKFGWTPHDPNNSKARYSTLYCPGCGANGATKQCNVCMKDKPLSSFLVTDGLWLPNLCKECNKKECARRKQVHKDGGTLKQPHDRRYACYYCGERHTTAEWASLPEWNGLVATKACVECVTTGAARCRTDECTTGTVLDAHLAYFVGKKFVTECTPCAIRRRTAEVSNAVDVDFLRHLLGQKKYFNNTTFGDTTSINTTPEKMFEVCQLQGMCFTVLGADGKMYSFRFLLQKHSTLTGSWDRLVPGEPYQAGPDGRIINGVMVPLYLNTPYPIRDYTPVHGWRTAAQPAPVLRVAVEHVLSPEQGQAYACSLNKCAHSMISSSRLREDPTLDDAGVTAEMGAAFLAKLAIGQGLRCTYSNIPFAWDAVDGNKFRRASPERADVHKGYYPGNVELVLRAFNIQHIGEARLGQNFPVAEWETGTCVDEAERLAMAAAKAHDAAAVALLLAEPHLARLWERTQRLAEEYERRIRDVTGE